MTNRLLAVALAGFIAMLAGGGAAGCGGSNTNGGGSGGGSGTVNGTVILSSTIAQAAKFSTGYSTSYATASGTVLVPGAICTVEGTDKSGTTDQNGIFTINGVSPGSHILICKKAVADGNTYAFLKIVEVSDGQSLDIGTLEITLAGKIQGKATISGQTDHTGVKVYIPGTSLQATTDATGAYLINNVPEGTYQLRLENTGYMTVTLPGIVITAGQTKLVGDVVLSISTGASGGILIENGSPYATSRTVTVSITASSNATLMQISEESNFLGATWQPITTTTTYTFLSDGQKRLYIKFADANGLESAPVSDDIIVDTVPSAPTGVSATAGDAQSTISWSAVSGATSYNIYWSTTTGVSTATGTKITNATSGSAITGLTNGTTYYYIVTAVNLGGESVASSQVSAMPVPPIPAAPTGVTATAGNAQNTISWTAVTGATSYNIYWSTTTGVTTATGTKITGSTSPYTHSTLTNGTTYYYIVTAVNLGGESAASAQLSAMPLLSAPTDTIAAAKNAQVTIAWSAVTGATSYNIYWSTTAGVTTATGTKITGATSPYNHTGLTNGTIYYYIVTAVNLGVESTACAQVSAAPQQPGPSVLMGGSMQGNPLNLTNTVTTFAGSTGSGSTDGTGAAARFNLPNGITTDGANLFVCTEDHTIRKVVISTGVVTTIAGSAGVRGSTDGTGAAASFNYPFGITTDGTNLFVVDSNNSTIRKIVISTGVVTTIAGSAYLTGSTDGTGTSARFNNPQGITTDGANLFVSDYFNHTIRKIVVSTGAVTTISGSAGLIGSIDGTGTAARYNYPFYLTTDGINLFVVDCGNHTIRKVVISTGAVTTIAGSALLSGSTDGTGTAARFNYPRGVTTDGTNLFVVDSSNSTIRKIVISTGAVTTIAGSAGLTGSTDGTGTSARFNTSMGVTTDGTNLFVADFYNNTIRMIQ